MFCRISGETSFQELLCQRLPIRLSFACGSVSARTQRQVHCNTSETGVVLCTLKCWSKCKCLLPPLWTGFTRDTTRAEQPTGGRNHIQNIAVAKSQTSAQVSLEMQRNSFPKICPGLQACCQNNSCCLEK